MIDGERRSVGGAMDIVAGAVVDGFARHARVFGAVGVCENGSQLTS